MNMQRFLKLFNFFIPVRCLLCTEKTNSSVALCAVCAEDLPIIIHPCRQCGIDIPVENNGLCGQCLKKTTKPWEELIIPFDYAPPINYFIVQLKFHANLAAADVLAHLLSDKIKAYYQHNPPWPEVIIPTPLHWRRLCKRGFNQAVEIAKPLAKEFNIPLDMRHHKRKRATKMQSDLSAKDRSLNVKSAFIVSNPFPWQHVAIVDDVVTTGSTIQEFAHTLKAAQVKRIDIWACARAQ